MTLKVPSNKLSGGGERSWKVKRRKIKWESRTQKLSGFSFDSIRVWIRASSERRKKPSREGLGRELEEVTEGEETLMET